MNLSTIWKTIAATSLLVAATAATADSMECDGNLVSPGDSQETVLQNCGEPTSREGFRWIYQVDAIRSPKSSPLVTV